MVPSKNEPMKRYSVGGLPAVDGSFSSALHFGAILVVALWMFLETARAQIFVASYDLGTVSEYTTSGVLLNASLISGLHRPAAIAVSGTNLFVVIESTGTIGEYTTSGTTVNASLISGLNNPVAIAVSGTSMFVANTGNGTIGEYTTSGTTVNASLISGLNNPVAIAVSGTSMFVANTGNGTIGEYTTSGTTVNASLISGLDKSGDADGITVVGTDLFVVNYYWPIFTAVNRDFFSIGEYTTSGSTKNPEMDLSVVSGSPPASIASVGTALFVAFGDGILPGSVQEYTTSGATINTSLVPSSQGNILAILGPAFLVQPKSVMLAAGQTASFFVEATGVGPFGYQWNLNGTPISGATDQYLLVSNVSSANAGSYNCVVTDANGYSSPSLSGTLSVTATANIGRLINFSALGQLGKSQILTIGFFTGGAGTTDSQPLLVQAIGPTLSTVGVTGVMPDPQLNAFSNQTVIAANTGWGTPSSNQLAVTAADAATYATALTNPTSKDSATVVPLTPGGYTVQVSSVSGVTGTALAALYDDTRPGTYTATTPRLINLSCLLQVSANSSLTAGFWIGGTTEKTVLIRADGPALTAQNVKAVMPDPQLTVFDSNGTAIAYNAGWGGSAVMFSVAASVGAQPFTSATANDSEVLLTLPPGGYTAQVTSASNTAGNVMIEVYEVP